MMVREAVEFLDGAANLQLRIEDAEVVEWLRRFDDPDERVKLVKQALKIGVIAMTSAWAGGTTQTIRQALEGWRAEVENAVNNAIQQSRDQIISQISERFDRQVAEPVVSQIDQIARNAVERIRERVDDLERRIDPSHPESWLGVINGAIDELKDAFDPNKEDSYLWLVRNTLSEFYGRDGEAIRCINDLLQQGFKPQLDSIQENLVGLRNLIEAVIRGFRRELGVEFEKVVGQLLREVALPHDQVEYVGEEVGKSGKAGDWLIQVRYGSVDALQTIGKIVVEAKRREKLTKPGVKSELEDAIQNRDADAGIYVIASDVKNPYGVSFTLLDGDCSKIVCALDPEGANLRLAYHLARFALVEKHLRASMKAEIDLVSIRQKVQSVIEKAKLLEKVEKQVRESKKAAEEAEGLCAQIRGELLDHLNDLMETLTSSTPT